MKITSSTSITSTYGTMLISFIRRRARIASGPRWFVRAREPRLGLTLQDVGELFHEALEAHGEAIDVVGEAVVGDHCGYGREKADRGRDQGLCDPRGDGCKSRLRHVGEAAERMHDAPYRAEKPDVGTHRAHRGEEGEAGLEAVHLALVSSAHRAARPVHHGARVGHAALALEFRELAVPGLENPLEAPGRMPVVYRALEQRGEVRAAPEIALELFSPALGAVDGEELEKDEVPGHEGHDQEQQYHQLNDDARARDHREDREVLGRGHRNPSSFFRIASGTATGL